MSGASRLVACNSSMTSLVKGMCAVGWRLPACTTQPSSLMWTRCSKMSSKTSASITATVSKAPHRSSAPNASPKVCKRIRPACRAASSSGTARRCSQLVDRRLSARVSEALFGVLAHDVAPQVEVGVVTAGPDSGWLEHAGWHHADDPARGCDVGRVTTMQDGRPDGDWPDLARIDDLLPKPPGFEVRSVDPADRGRRQGNPRRLRSQPSPGLRVRGRDMARRQYRGRGTVAGDPCSGAGSGLDAPTAPAAIRWLATRRGGRGPALAHRRPGIVRGGGHPGAVSSLRRPGDPRRRRHRRPTR